MIRLSSLIEKVKFFLEENKSDLYVATLIFLVSLASFGLGRLSILWPEKEPITITNNQLPVTSNVSGEQQTIPTESQAASAISAIKGKYVASKNGASYHYPWCQGAQRIKEENKIWFQTKEEAEKAGYKPAGNCEGL